MATGKMSEVIQHLRRVVLLRDGGGLTDRQLLERFISGREDAAIAALVHRHGPMVWAVCRRVLRNHHDAEDAFQATFLVLVRKPASIVSKELVANWLYGVAHQTAMKAKHLAAKRRGRERCLMDMPEPKGVDPDRSHDLELLLDQELSRLPDKYRSVIVLCDLQGKTRKEAARQLGVPEGTVASRLAAARAKLAKRLARHGLALGGGSLAAALSQNASSASVPASVMSTTIKAVTQVAAGKAAATGLISANVAALTEGVIKAMLLTKLKAMTALLLMLSMVTLTSVLLLAWGQMGSASTPDKGNSGEKPATKAEKPVAQAQPKDPPKEFTNSIGMKFVWIKPGNFTMGSPKKETVSPKKEIEILPFPDPEDDSGPNDETQHKVTLTKGFYMGVYTVTQEEWQAVMGNYPSQFKGEKNLPVEAVSWNDCQEFIKKLREKDKKPYRLPTESEWEYSCRAGTVTPFHFGDTISTDQANYFGGAVYGNGKKGVYRKKTTPVGSFPANAWGLHDMHGNVWQWCQDWYGNYPQKDVVDPQGPEKGDSRVQHGGSWINDPQCCRSACRFCFAPDFRDSTLGFRVCFFLEQEATPNGNPTDAEGNKEQPLTVTIKSQKNPIRHREPFKVDLRVVNLSKSPQSFQVMNCSWYQHWISSTEFLSWEKWDCAENSAVTVKLAPGEAYEKTLAVWPCLAKPAKKLSFKMGFTPIGSKQTFWSNEITLQVEPPSDKKGVQADHGVFIEDAVLSPDGSRVATSARDAVRSIVIWDAASGKSIRDLSIKDFGQKYQPRPEYQGRLAFSPDGKQLAAVIVDNQDFLKSSVWLFDVDSGKVLHRFEGFSNNKTRPQFLADGKQLFLSNSEGVTCLEIATGKKLRAWKFPDRYSGLNDVTVSPDGKYLAWQFALWHIQNPPATLPGVVRDPPWPGPYITATTVVITDAVTDKILCRKERSFGGNFTPVFSHDGLWFMTGGDMKLAAFDTATGKELFVLPAPEKFEAAQFTVSPDGRWGLAVEYLRTYLWDLKTRKLERELRTGEGEVNVRPLQSSQIFSADGKKLVLATGSAWRLFDLADAKK